MSKVSKCPYCADPDLFDKRLAPTSKDGFNQTLVPRRGSHWPEPPKVKIVPMRNVKYARWGGNDPRGAVELKTLEIIRGKYRVRTITDADMIARYAGFQMQVIGVESRTEPPMPSGVFMGRRSEKKDGKPLYVLFDAVRITHKDSPIVVDSHWHPSHGRKVSVRGFGRVAPTAEELGVVTTALSFDTKAKKRGAPPKVDRDVVIEAIRTQGEKATQKSIASATGIAHTTLRDWLYFREGTTWLNLKREIVEGRRLGE
jgi:hypothetical protein